MNKLAALLVATVVASSTLAEASVDKKLFAGKKNVEFGVQAEVAKGALPWIKAIAVTKNDYLIVAGPKVVVFSPEGKEVIQFETNCAVNSCCSDDKGNIYIGSYASKGNPPKVYKFSAKGKLLKEWNSLKGNKGTIQAATGMNTFKNHLYVSDTRLQCVHKYTLDGEYVKTIGKMRQGKKRGEFATCCGILDFGVNPTTGDLYIGNLGRHNVSITKNDGKSFRAFGKRGKEESDFCGCCNPVNMAVTASGYIVTAEKTIPRIKVYDPKSHKMLAVMGKGIFDKSCGNLDIAVDSQCNIYAIDTKKNCILKFAPGADNSASSK